MRDSDNIRQLLALKPDFIGFIFFPSSKRFADKINIDVLKVIPESVKKTGVFVNLSEREIAEKIIEYQLDVVQLHGDENPEFCLRIKSYSVKVIKAFGIDNAFDFSILNNFKDSIDYFLFDTKTTQYGGSGLSFNWGLLNQYTLNIPYFLSGGLSEENLSEIQNLNDDRLHALDLNSRFELSPGLKDIERLQSFFTKIKGSAESDNKIL
jgi:phosphoribosylanthranilate isomerase